MLVQRKIEEPKAFLCYLYHLFYFHALHSEIESRIAPKTSSLFGRMQLLDRRYVGPAPLGVFREKRSEQGSWLGKI